jgi:hypothetical protein
MKDKIRFHYVEAQVEITCVVCNTTFTDFPDSDDSSIMCQGKNCGRQYSFLYSIEPMNSQEILKQKIKTNLLSPKEEE